MIKVLFCAYDQPNSVGGPISWLINLLPKLKNESIEPECLILFQNGENGNLHTSLTSNGIKCHVNKYQEYTNDNIKWILKISKENNIDIFVPNLVVAGYYASKWLKNVGIATIGVIHSDDPFYHDIIDEFISKRRFRLTGAVCVSSELKGQLVQKNPNFKNIKQIPCGVKLTKYTANRKQSLFRIAYVGRIAEEQKRISDVALAFCKMVKEIEGTEGLFFGDGPDKERLLNILKTNGEGLPLKYIGLLPNDEMIKSISECDVIVLLSDYEGLPIAIMEAMASGVVPVCLKMRSGIDELIINNKTGLVVNDRDQDFIEAIRTLKNDVALWNMLSANSKEYIKNNFSENASVKLWHNFLMQNYNPKHKRIKIPYKLFLPSPRKNLQRADRRKPKFSTILRMYRRTRIYAGKLKRQLF